LELAGCAQNCSVVAAVIGFAQGGGGALAMMCNLIIATS
jgi:1,4-dihydroxy-2-naphthoyl-CoA synthase